MCVGRFAISKTLTSKGGRRRAQRKKTCRRALGERRVFSQIKRFAGISFAGKRLNLIVDIRQVVEEEHGVAFGELFGEQFFRRL